MLIIFKLLSCHRALLLLHLLYFHEGGKKNQQIRRNVNESMCQVLIP